jgi:PadR family transcriptional regulator PadR
LEMQERDSLGPFEQLVLAAVASLDDAYGVTIREQVEQWSGKPVKFGSIYTTLDRLYEKRYLSSWMTEPLAERGGRAKRCYRLEPAGMAMLEESLRTADRVMPVLRRILAEGAPGRTTT